MALRGLDPTTGQEVWLKNHSGDGSPNFPIVLERADPIAHSKIDVIKTSVDRLLDSPLVHIYNRTAASAVLKASSGKLHGFYIFNTGTTDCFLQFFNTSAAPTTGATGFALCPLVVFGEEKFAIGEELFGRGGLDFSGGITYGLSSSSSQYTPIASPNQIMMFITYR